MIYADSCDAQLFVGKQCTINSNVNDILTKKVLMITHVHDLVFERDKPNIWCKFDYPFRP